MSSTHLMGNEIIEITYSFNVKETIRDN